MAEDKGKQNKPPYDVDDILAEYGSGKYAKNSKVVEFPQKAAPSPADKPAEESPDEAKRSAEIKPPVEDRPSAEPRPEAKHRPVTDEPELIPEITPESVGRHIGARLSTLMRRADHYADHMYDLAEPDEKTRKAEKYLPGVDREEQPANGKSARKKPRRPVEMPPDVSPAELAARRGEGLKGQRARLDIAAVLAVITLMLSLEAPFLSWTALEGIGLTAFQFRSLVLTALLLVVGLLCLEVPATGAKQLVSLRPGAESVLLLAWVFTLLDGLTAGSLEPRYAALPCAAVTALGLVFALWGTHACRQGDRISAKEAAHARKPYVVSLDEDKWNAKPAFAKWSGSPVGFGSQLQMENGAQLVYRVAAPLLILGGLLCALLASVGQSASGRFPWAASTCFTAAASWSALLTYALPYRRLAARLSKVGAALAGWPGVARCGQAGIIMTDGDLFPTGSVTVTQVNVYGGAATEKVIGYTATLLRVMDCGLTRPFHDLLRTQGAMYREVSGVRFHEGGVSGIIRNQEVLVGTAAFMHMMEVPMPAGHNIKNAIFCAIDGQLCGLFPLNYTMSEAVNPSLSALLSAGVSPVLATRDPNLIPAMLEQKFKLPVGRMDFPAVDRRLELSQRDQEHDDTPVALLSREGLTAYCDAVIGGRRLRLATRWGLIVALIGSVVGLCLTYYLTSVGAFASLTVVNFLVFMLAWLVPQWVIVNWANQF